MLLAPVMSSVPAPSVRSSLASALLDPTAEIRRTRNPPVLRSLTVVRRHLPIDPSKDR
jgi:hypothetical protein